MLPDSECLKVLCEILNKLNFNSYLIKINHRKLLDCIYEVCGAPNDKFNAITSTIDKLDKINWSDVSDILVNQHNIGVNVVEKIKNFINNKGEFNSVLSQIKQNSEIKSNKTAINALNELELLYKYCEILKISDKV